MWEKILKDIEKVSRIYCNSDI